MRTQQRTLNVVHALAVAPEGQEVLATWLRLAAFHCFLDLLAEGVLLTLILLRFVFFFLLDKLPDVVLLQHLVLSILRAFSLALCRSVNSSFRAFLELTTLPVLLVLLHS